MEITFGKSNSQIIKAFRNLPARKTLAQALETKGLDSTKILRTYEKPSERKALSEFVGKVGNMIRENKTSAEIFNAFKEFHSGVNNTKKPKTIIGEAFETIRNSFKAKKALDRGVAPSKVDWMFFNP